MAPPGINTFFDHLDIMTFSSVYSPASHLKSGFSSSATLFPTSTALSDASSSLSSIHSDHDYSVKPVTNSLDYIMSSKTIEHNLQSMHSDSNGDAMLSSCVVDFEKVPGDGADTDFLKELDDLNFSFDDLDPCCEVAMEDSFQDFIDSALEQSYPSYLSENSIDRHASDKEPVILNKEQFLATLNLRSAQESQNGFELWSLSSTPVIPGSSLSSNSSLDKSALDMISQASSKFSTPAFDVIPTKQCSCTDLESVFKTVYSTAHAPYQDCVRICPSTATPCMKVDLNYNRDFSQNHLTPERLLTPLFIDTSSSGLSKCSEKSSKDRQDCLKEDDMFTRIDRETADIMKWLSESQPDDQQQYNDSNNNVIGRICGNSASTVAETSHQGSTIAPSLDLESFVDIEECDLEKLDNDETQHTDFICERTADKSKHSNTNIPCISGSHLKFSFLIEHMDLRENVKQGTYSNVFSNSSVLDKLSPHSSDLSYCGFSPAWSRTDSSQTSVSPLPLTNRDLLLSSNFDEAMDDESVTSPLALLNLFSDENATSLLHTDSTVPNFRFM